MASLGSIFKKSAGTVGRATFPKISGVADVIDALRNKPKTTPKTTSSSPFTVLSGATPTNKTTYSLPPVTPQVGTYSSGGSFGSKSSPTAAAVSSGLPSSQLSIDKTSPTNSSRSGWGVGGTGGKTTTALAGTPTSTGPGSDAALASFFAAESQNLQSGNKSQAIADSKAYTGTDTVKTQLTPSSPGATPAPTATPYTPPQPNAVIEALRSKITNLSAPSAEEQALNDELAQLRGDAELGIANLEGQGRGIPLSLVRGQQAKLGEQAAIKEGTLMDRIAALSADRQNQLLAAQNEYTMAAAEQARQDAFTAPVTMGNSILQFDPATGTYKTLYSAPEQAAAPTSTIQEYEYAKQNGYTGSFVDYQTAQAGSSGGATDFNELLSVTEAQTLGVPYGTTKGEAYGISTEKPLSAEMLKLQENAKSGLDSLSLIRGTIGDGNRPIIANQGYKAAEANLVDVIGRLRSGGAITVDEETRFKSLLPSIRDSGQVASQKLDTLESLLNGVLQDQGSGGAQDDPLGLGFSGVGGDTNKAASVTKAIATAYPENTKGGQCGRFVNNLTGIGMGDSFDNKMSFTDPSIKVPQPGDVFVMPYSWTGHTGVVVGTPIQKDDGSFDIPVADSNYHLDEKVDYHTINSKSIAGYARVPLKSQYLA